MEILFISITILIVLGVLATCCGVRYVWTHDSERRYARWSDKPSPALSPWLPVETVWQEIEAEEARHEARLSFLTELSADSKSISSSTDNG